MDNEKMTFTYRNSGLNVVVTVGRDSDLETTITAFEGFLRAATYMFDGHLEIVDRESK